MIRHLELKPVKSALALTANTDIECPGFIGNAIRVARRRTGIFIW